MVISRYLWLPILMFAAAANADDATVDAAVGGAIGGATGAVIGHELGGRDGAILGGALGAAVGTAITTDSHKRYLEPRDYAEPRREHDYYRSAPGFCPPGQANKGRC